MIVSQWFFDGYYADKVMEIHSNQSGGEKDENIERLVSLENPSNKIEIVIHVNMLKEGWDVTNLYTIIPLKTAAALLYCKNASEFTTQNGGKPWKYILIPHNAVMVNMSFETLARQFEVSA